MATGIRVEIRVEDPERCPIAGLSTEVDQPITTISWSGVGETQTVVEEFTTKPDQLPGEYEGVETVFETDQYARHRFSRNDEGCACQQIERLGSPVESVRAVNGGLTLSFYVLDTEGVHQIITKLREEFDNVKIRRLHRVGGPDNEVVEGDDLVWVDRESLTDRQREVLETAHEMGYFDYPRESNATEVADSIGIGPSTFSEHLAVAQSKVLDAVLAQDDE